MNFFLKFSIILLITAWLGVDVTLGCNSTTIEACGQPIASIPEADRTNLNLVCQKTSEVMKCLRDLGNKCGGSFNATLQKKLTEMNETEAMCQGFGANTSCSMTSILACVEQLAKMPDEDKRDFSKACRHVENSVNCLNKEIDSCPLVLRERLQSQKVKLNQSLAICTPFLNITGNSSCNQNSIMACAQPLTNMTESERKDNRSACQKIKVAEKCLTDAIDTCPDLMQGMLQTQRIRLQASLAVCETHQNNTNSSVSPTCSYNAIMLCIKPLTDMTAPERYDLSKTCPKMEKAVTCITDGIDTCPASMQSMLQAQRDQLKSTLTPCKNLQGSVSSGNTGCSTMNVNACLIPVHIVVSNKSITDDVKCPTTLSAFNCLLHKRNNCPSTLQPFLTAAENMLEQTRVDCLGYWNGTTPGPQVSFMMVLVVVFSMLRQFL